VLGGRYEVRKVPGGVDVVLKEKEKEAGDD
jgi:hypothetical protein